MNFGVGAGVDMMTLTGTLSSTSATPPSNDINGSGIGFIVDGLASYDFAPTFTGFANVGYRIADIDIDDIGGQNVSAAGLNSEDYSGVVLRVGLSVHQP